MDEKPWLGNEYYEVLRTAGRLNTALPEEAAAIDRGEIDSHGIGHRRAAELEQALDAFGATSYARGQAYEANAQWAQLPRLKAAEQRADRLAAALQELISAGRAVHAPESLLSPAIAHARALRRYEVAITEARAALAGEPAHEPNPTSSPEGE